ncbi:putative dimethylaniline monooxygenase [Corynespora cassiicola Philippines]|uniref:Putative dimethylaniline monooxygenase n=1 Tax=Corynespora cassiicola Philippines TaxID=1448308 RepID=A0A2T2N8H3_CORCC|nr:putative dimethylaniline monooxygenase [Corynespora cassiicola Philippines]
MAETYDTIVVGAGWFGLAAAKTRIQLHPHENVAVFESAESCGGTWSKNRLYPGLKSNNMVDTYEYPDFPMSESKYGVAKFNHIPGAVLHRYLTDYAKHFGVFERVQFHTQVDLVHQLDDGSWRITVSTPKGVRDVVSKRLIVATGLTSTPNMPHYKNEAEFGAPLFHAKDFCQEAQNLGPVKNAVVVGGAKSAFDVAYAMVEDGATVDLVIRHNGHGPVWIAPRFVTPFKKRLDALLNIRWMTWMAPCPWGGEDGFSWARNFLHGTVFGRMFVDFFWKMLSGDVIAANGYDSDPALQKLKPWNSAFWIGSGLSILNYNTDLFALVKEGKIRVHISDIDHLEPKKVVLLDGTVLDADVMVCSTGWKKESSLKFSGLGEEKFDLAYSEKEKAKLNYKTDEKVLSMFPRLANQPELRFEPKKSDPLRMYRFIVPSTFVEKRNIAFSGMVSCVSTAMCANTTALWISAFFDGKLQRIAQTKEEITDEVMLHTQWGKWRYPCGYGASLPDMVFEGLPYFDMLLRDMGLETHRHRGWWAELTSPYYPSDYAGLVDEWVAKQNGTGAKV